MTGGQAALEVGFFAAFIGIGIGTICGAIAGPAGGVLDSIMMRIVDIFLSVPFLFIVLIVAVKYGASVLGLSLIIGAFTWLVPARLVRGEVLTLRVRDFVSAARTAGSGRTRLIARHMIPNTLGTIVVNVTFQVADAILATAALGFLGFGLHYPHQDWATCSPTAPPTCKTGTGGSFTRSARLHRAGRHGLQPRRRRAARLAGCPAAAPMRRPPPAPRRPRPSR